LFEAVHPIWWHRLLEGLLPIYAYWPVLSNPRRSLNPRTATGPPWYYLHAPG